MTKLKLISPVRENGFIPLFFILQEDNSSISKVVFEFQAKSKIKPNGLQFKLEVTRNDDIVQFINTNNNRSQNVRFGFYNTLAKDDFIQRTYVFESKFPMEDIEGELFSIDFFQYLKEGGYYSERLKFKIKKANS